MYKYPMPEENPPRFKHPYRVDTWFERDRKSIVVYDADDREIAEWWDDEVDAMVESGYFDSSGFIMGREVRKGRLSDSVLKYVEEMGLDKPRRNPGDVHIDIGSHNNPPVKLSPEEIALSQRLDRAAAMRREAAANQSAVEILTTQELPQAGMIKGMRVHYVLRKPLAKMAEAEKIILAQFPGMRMVSHYSLRPEVYGRKAYGMMLDRKMTGIFRGKNPPPGEPISLGMVKSIRHVAKNRKIRVVWGKDGLLRLYFPSGRILQARSDDDAREIRQAIESGEINPPLPASALMELGTALSIVKEILAGQRPVQELTEAKPLMVRAMSKLRDSHQGMVDYSNPPATEIYRNIIEIRAEKADGKRYVHKFGKGSNIFGLSNGDILIRSRRGKKLWKNFTVEG